LPKHVGDTSINPNSFLTHLLVILQRKIYILSVVHSKNAEKKNENKETRNFEQKL
jgi:hypothetical protein